MEEKKRSRRDFIQNITITLLSLLAVVLFVRTQVYGFSALSSLREPSAISGTVIAQEADSFSAPVRVAVSGSYGRYGSITLTTASEAFSPLGSLLGQVLGSAQMYTESGEEEFLAALEHPSVYYDFLEPLPLSILGGLVGAEGTDSLSARHLVIAEMASGVVLCLSDHADRYLRCTTALSRGELEAVIGQYEQGGALFALDTVETYGEYAAAVHPLSLFLTETELPVLDSAGGSVSSVQVLSALGFNPHTQTRWTESGTEVIVDGDRTLRLRSDDSLYYQSGGSSVLQITAAGETPTLWEAASDVSALLGGLLPEGSGAQLYLRSISRSGTAATLTFDYQFGGIPIRFSDGNAAAKVTLSGTSVSSISFTSRQYAASDETALLLPLRQAMAVAAQTPDRELFIGYADYSKEQTSPQWLSE